ncbi:MAG: hypothetical protein F4Y91_02090 [Gemmatimonadetes bacterium]|nr:hypothetical protein [Gemmatimonadota bacterium]MXY80881.1 hypothetical protein [Gemmatimonadota bacterium]MYA23442.1 hypothetical protein [Gemmatimonadota bacterium]MYB69534.1 hypothetical protein [Gemmatimonadota bacterium]
MLILRSIALAILLAPAILAADGAGHSVGFVAGPTYGLGLSYGRQNPTTGNGWQVSGFPYWSQEERYLFGGLTLFKTLHQGEWARAFFSGGVAAFYRRSEQWDFVSGRLDIEVKPEVKVGLHVEGDKGIDERLDVVAGPGVGLEIGTKNLAVSMDVPIAFFLVSDDGFAIRPIPNFALLYRW